MLAGNEPGGDARALQQILAARTRNRLRPTAVSSTPRWSNGASSIKILTGHTGRGVGCGV